MRDLFFFAQGPVDDNVAKELQKNTNLAKSNRHDKGVFSILNLIVQNSFLLQKFMGYLGCVSSTEFEQVAGPIDIHCPPTSHPDTQKNDQLNPHQFDHHSLHRYNIALKLDTEHTEKSHAKASSDN